MLTKGAIGNLVNRYKAVLKKCKLINTFGSLAVASMLVLGGAGVASAISFDSTLAIYPSGATTSYTLTKEDNEFNVVSSGRGIEHGTSKHFSVIGGEGSSISIESTGNHAVVAGPGLVELEADTVTLTAASRGAYSDGHISIKAKEVTIESKNSHAISFEDGINPVDKNDITIIADKATITGPTAVSAQHGGILNLSVKEATLNGTVVLYKNETGTGTLNILSGATTINGKVYQDGGRTTVAAGATLNIASGEFTKGTSKDGGAIFNGGTLSVDGATFSGNTASSVGGAIASGTKSVLTAIKNATFTDNHAVYDGGAIGNYGPMTIENASFIGNTAQLDNDGNGNWTVAVTDDTAIGGGAISLGAVSTTSIASIENAYFESNVSGFNGGAIATRMAKDATNANAKLTIAANFKNNEAKASGGAIYNTFYAGEKGVEVTGAFEGNKAGKSGGAIYNDGTTDDNDLTPGTMTITNATFTSNTAGSNGGAIFNGGSLSVDGATFTGNTAGSIGGAISSGTKSVLTAIKNATFSDNHAMYDGGAIGNYGPMTIENASFIGNTAQLAYDEETKTWSKAVTDDTAIGGGAISLGAVSTTSIASIENAYFESNVSGFNGGAIATRMAKDATNANAKLTIAANFKNNEAKASGGAIYNTFYAGEKGVEVTGAFEGNKAGVNGGAIYNDGTTDANDLTPGTMTITDSTFTGNSAEGLGGAIYNSGKLTLEGSNVFSGNTAGGVANDIHNLGTLTISGDITLDGGITGETGTVDMAGANITVTNADVVVEGDVTATDATVTATGEVNDAISGNASVLAAKLGTTAGELAAINMEEGLIAGAVTNGVQKVNTVLADTLEQATAAPLAVNRILMNDVRKRMGDLRSDKNESGVWMRWDGGKLSGDGGLTNNFNTIQIGGDTKVAKNCRFGVAGSFTHGDIDQSNGGGEMESYTFAAYGTWMAENGMFADVIARVGFTNSELQVKGSTADLDNEALSLSAEYGWRLPVCDQFFLEPQVELTYTHVTGADFTIKSAKYDVDSVDSVIGRAGLVAGWNLPNDRGNLYARASVVHEFLGDSKISATNNGGYAAHELDGNDTWLEYGIGANVKLTDKTYIWADVERTEGADLDEKWRGTVGIRYSF